MCVPLLRVSAGEVGHNSHNSVMEGTKDGHVLKTSLELCQAVSDLLLAHGWELWGGKACRVSHFLPLKHTHTHTLEHTHSKTHPCGGFLAEPARPVHR